MDQYLDAEERMVTEISDSNGIVRPQKLSNKETKALPKQEGQNIFWVIFFLIATFNASVEKKNSASCLLKTSQNLMIYDFWSIPTKIWSFLFWQDFSR